MDEKNHTYTIAEAALYLKVSDRTIRRWISRNLLRTSKSLRKKIIPAEDVEKFIERTC
jgi:excisionase family DNA binding protein